MARLNHRSPARSRLPAKHHGVADADHRRAAAASRARSRCFCTARALAGHLEAIGGYVRFQGSLDMRVRVLAAMVVARELDGVYVWGAQTGSARKQGVPESTITAIREKHSRGVPKEDAEIIDFTRALLNKHRVSAEAFESIRKRFGEEQLIELTGSIGYYAMLCMTVNACELEAGQGAEVLQP